MVLIVTDGAQTPPGNPNIPANKLKRRGFEIYAVGAGSSRTSRQQHRELAQLQNSGLYYVGRTSEIRNLAIEVGQAICPRKYEVVIEYSQNTVEPRFTDTRLMPDRHSAISDSCLGPGRTHIHLIVILYCLTRVRQ